MYKSYLSLVPRAKPNPFPPDASRSHANGLSADILPRIFASYSSIRLPKDRERKVISPPPLLFFFLRKTFARAARGRQSPRGS
jgi:hypothetical protein